MNERDRQLANAIRRLIAAENRAQLKFDEFLRSGNRDAGGFQFALNDLVEARTTTTLAIIAAGEDGPTPQQVLPLT